MLDNLRVVHFEDAQLFVDAVKEYDDSSLNFTFGSLLDNMDDTQSRSQARWGPKDRVLLGVYQGDNLLITLTKNAQDFSWMMAVPSRFEESLSTEVVNNAVELLARSLPQVVDPDRMDKVIGPEEVVDTFIQAWVRHMADIGISLKALPPYFRSRVSYATASSLLPPSPESSCRAISLAHRPEDITSLIPLVIEFSSHGPVPSTEDTARAEITEAVDAQRVWLCRISDTVAGYIMVGRSTPRTVAIRNVFVLPQYRRRGVAEAMVRAVTRYYLGAYPLGFEGAPEGPPICGTKAEICLNVADENAVRLYKRCGFLLDEDARDSSTGRKGSFASIWRGVERVAGI
ncbi:hypothetical protein OBBRIDRAFT_727453 [Obba rivulosa]|uniref:N-acetyltransferase domain-containing protein n=1 Tax=Obba rivulosa TaxID=1052685 RepID=A0A8E2B589_9APHY|nr:hypothetical protein OBBRIDRAFT_727453 [Obba rivulosa]